MTGLRRPCKPRVLVVEDEPDLLETLVSYLTIEGMQAHGVSDLAKADAWIARNEFDVLLLDLGLTDGDGIEWLKLNENLRNKGLIITTARSDAASRISGIRAGADVYLVKPLLLEEVASLVLNLMRRLHGNALSLWVLESKSWRLNPPDGTPLKLTHNEHMLLKRLAQSSGKVVSQENLVVSLGHDPSRYDYRRLEILIRRLRNKAQKTWGHALPLETAHRHGYAFTEMIQIQEFPDRVIIE